MKVLVTGAGGLLGSCVSAQIATKTNWQLLACTRAQLDITQKAQVFSQVAEFKPDFIINTAAYTKVDSAQLDAAAAFAVNAEGVKYLAQAAHLQGACLLHVSTDYVFDGTQAAPYREDALTNPINHYGASKLAGELAAKELVKHIIVRTSWLFDKNGHNFFTTMRRLLQQQNTINVVCDQIGGPTYVGDLTAAILSILQRYAASQKMHWGIYHYAGMPFVSWYEFAQYIALNSKLKKMGENTDVCITPITSECYAASARRPKNSRLCCDKIHEIFNIKSSDWRKAIAKIDS